MFRIEEVRKNDSARMLISSFAAHFAAMVLVVTMVLGPADASARRPPTPQNFRVTAATAYTVSVAWDPAPANSGDFNYHLSGAYGVTPAILPKAAMSHTFTRLHPGNRTGQGQRTALSLPPAEIALAAHALAVLAAKSWKSQPASASGEPPQ